MAASVSVCVPTYQGERFLRETIDSVFDQDFDDFELVVCDNASTDGTADILASYSDPRLRVVRSSEPVDLPANWRRAAAACTGTYLKVLCADDLLAPDALSRQVAALERHPEVSLVASRCAIIDEDSRVVIPASGLRGLLGQHDGAAVARTFVRRGGINSPGVPATALFRRADYERIGGWDGRYVFPMDVDLWIRLGRLGGFLGLPETLAAFRVGDSHLSAARTSTQYEEMRALVREVGRDRTMVRPWEAWSGAVLSRVVWQTHPRRERRKSAPGLLWREVVAGMGR